MGKRIVAFDAFEPVEFKFEVLALGLGEGFIGQGTRERGCRLLKFAVLFELVHLVGQLGLRRAVCAGKCQGAKKHRSQNKSHAPPSSSASLAMTRSRFSRHSTRRFWCSASTWGGAFWVKAGLVSFCSALRISLSIFSSSFFSRTFSAAVSVAASRTR